MGEGRGVGKHSPERSRTDRRCHLTAATATPSPGAFSSLSASLRRWWLSWVIPVPARHLHICLRIWIRLHLTPALSARSGPVITLVAQHLAIVFIKFFFTLTFGGLGTTQNQDHSSLAIGASTRDRISRLGVCLLSREIGLLTGHGLSGSS
jgi:hypothetical protein